MDEISQSGFIHLQGLAMGLTKYSRPIMDGLKKALLARWAASRAESKRSCSPADDAGIAIAS